MYLQQNLKYLRKNATPKATQEQMSEMLGISPSAYGAYEEGRAEPKTDTLLKLAAHYGVSLEALLTQNLANETASIARTKSFQPSTRILATTVNTDNEDNIELVPLKAAAGYTRGHADPDFIQTLPTFHVPFLSKQKKHRAFAIEGDSMLPIPSGALVFGVFEDDWLGIKDQTPCILLTQNEGVVFKMVYNYLSERGCFLLASTNKLYKPYIVPAEEILEVWKFEGYFTFQFPEIHTTG